MMSFPMLQRPKGFGGNLLSHPYIALNSLGFRVILRPAPSDTQVNPPHLNSFNFCKAPRPSKS